MREKSSRVNNILDFKYVFSLRLSASAPLRETSHLRARMTGPSAVSTNPFVLDRVVVQ